MFGRYYSSPGLSYDEGGASSHSRGNGTSQRSPNSQAQDSRALYSQAPQYSRAQHPQAQLSQSPHYNTPGQGGRYSSSGTISDRLRYNAHLPQNQDKGKPADARVKSQAQRRITESYEDDTAPHDYPPDPHEPTSYRGETDHSTTDNEKYNILLVRNFKESATEEVLATGLKKLYRTEDGDDGARVGSLKCVLVIRSRRTDRGRGFGFALYSTPEDADAAVLKSRQLGDEFTLSSKVMEATFPTLKLFSRATEPPVEGDPKCMFSWPGKTEIMRYLHKDCYATAMYVNPVVPPSPPSQPRRSSGSAVSSLENMDRPNRKRKAEEDEEAQADVSVKVKFSLKRAK